VLAKRKTKLPTTTIFICQTAGSQEGQTPITAGSVVESAVVVVVMVVVADVVDWENPNNHRGYLGFLRHRSFHGYRFRLLQSPQSFFAAFITRRCGCKWLYWR